MASSQYTDAELDELTDEERAGLEEMEAEGRGEASEDDEPQSEASGDAEKAAKAEKGDESAEEPEAAPEVAAVIDAAVTDKPAEAPAAEAPAASPAAAAPAAPRLPQYELPENFSEQLTSLETRRTELATRFDDGELTAREYREQDRALEREERELHQQQLRAEMSRDMVVEAWKTQVATFLSAHPQYEKGSPLYAALDAEVRRLQQDADQPLDPKLLAEAHESVDRQIRAAMGMPAAGAAASAPKPAPKPAARQIEAPPTLAHVPAAGITETGDTGNYAALDRLMETNYEAYEAELAKMTDAQRDRYLAGS